MSAFSKSKKLLLGLGAITGVSALYYLNNERNKIVHASWTTSYEPAINSIWDDNWDHRSPKVLHKRHVTMKLVSEKDENELNEAKEKYGKPTANRHIILIRHGQYNLNGITDNERILTKLGRIQAEFTGKRLKELNLPYTDMVKSTMSRAQETGSIISTHLPDIPVKHCDLLREGAPIPPEPPVGHYRPELFKFFQDGSRIEAAFRKYFHRADAKQEKDSFTILVCHANVIRYFVCRALQFPAEAWLRLSLNHASITHVIITPSGRCILRTFGDSGFMPPDVITSH